MKVIYMLVVHEHGEIVIGDLMQFQISKEEKKILKHEAVHKILSGLLDANQIEELFLEFDAHNTKESMFAYQCDKLECDLQSKLYDEEGCVDLDKQVYPYDENFSAVSNYAVDNEIREKKKKLK